MKYSDNGYPRLGAVIAQRACIDQFDTGLYSVQGAQEIISLISSRRAVKTLILGHNQLCDAGCVALFEFLCSAPGQRYEISEISLNSNEIGDRGLASIVRYLKNNKHLKELFLQNNRFTGDAKITRALADAINTSELELLSLTTNYNMSDAFIAEFLPALTSPYLRELHLSVMHITACSLPHIEGYITSKRCKLNVLACNGNFLGLRSVRSIIRALKNNNYSLTRLELHSNHLLEGELLDENSSDEEPYPTGSTDVWYKCHQAIQRVVTRNQQLKQETEKQALQLLRYARTVLLHSPAIPASSVDPPGETRTKHHLKIGSLNGVGNASNVSGFSFRELPIEIQLHVLSFLAPILSSAQRISICTYAAMPSTLPPLLPRLEGSTTDWRPGKDRYHWLLSMGCTVYEPSE
ncbi:hypothetical protein AMATHDRAFT_76922 [Amanita thiersii Skay4041]|uniref:RNI-like protein n=1 Tax=Amanita thiersii Skay4041 TaxID=703135 RepID=A0A2A9NIB8_9AGAR|nr:hypothetical protein AMATHDRAFT_76922 [Amanita thiersii Skay4041]